MEPAVIIRKSANKELMDQHAKDTNAIGMLEVRNYYLREAHNTIATGRWTAGNSIETITWLARNALAKDDDLESKMEDRP